MGTYYRTVIITIVDLAWVKERPRNIYICALVFFKFSTGRFKISDANEVVTMQG